MKVLLLLVVAVVAVAHARHYSAEEEASYQSAESREAASSERRQLPAVAARRWSNEDDGSDSSDSSDSQERTTTEMPCPQVCRLIYEPVCVRDSEGTYRKFSNECMLRKCRCETDMEYEVVSLKKCRGSHVPECPRSSTPSRRPQPEEDLDVADSSASE